MWVENHLLVNFTKRRDRSREKITAPRFKITSSKRMSLPSHDTPSEERCSLGTPSRPHLHHMPGRKADSKRPQMALLRFPKAPESQCPKLNSFSPAKLFLLVCSLTQLCTTTHPNSLLSCRFHSSAVPPELTVSSSCPHQHFP